jgi:hypothetical protein
MFLHLLLFILMKVKKKGKAISVTGRGGPYGCETSRLPHFLDIRLTDGGKVVSLTSRLPFTPQEDSWYPFLLEAVFILVYIKKSFHLGDYNRVSTWVCVYVCIHTKSHT